MKRFLQFACYVFLALVLSYAVFVYRVITEVGFKEK